MNLENYHTTMTTNVLLNIGNDSSLIQITKKLEESHLVYLQTDESPLKLQQRKKLEGYIKDFLCLVPHHHKYYFHETADILRRSAQTMKDFSGYRACTAWNAISLYAANLLAQPWRKEYRTLRLFSGYYKHEVETNLVGAELMFELMGYKHVDIGVMQLDNPLDPDKVTNVSRDSIIAFVECQIVKQIWEAVTNKFPISWLEVLEFRENYVCSAEQAIRALSQRFLDKLSRGGYCPYDLAINNYVPCYQYPIEDPLYHVNYAADSRYNLLPHSTVYPQAVVPYSTTAPTQCRVPTGRLIELDTPTGCQQQDRAVLFNGKHSRANECDELVDRPDRYDYNRIVDKQDGNWDYVLRSLESQGYKKNLSDRDDVLQRHKFKSPDEEKYRARSLERRKDKYETTEKMMRDLEISESDYGHRETKVQCAGNQLVTEPTRVMQKQDEDAAKWNCASCTYLNKPDKEICEMCNKSRHKGNEDVPLASGSKECPKCTLINEKDAKTCAACDNSLKDSPTYI